MREAIEVAGFTCVQIGPMFGAELDAIVQSNRGQFL